MDYQRNEIQEGQGRQPSQVTDDTWLFARQSWASSYATDGKWLFYAQREKIDAIWKIIALATEEGCLGCLSKVSTCGLPLTAETSVHAICIYTTDSSNRDDVMRVRAMLRTLGITAPISYVTWNSNQDQITLYKE